MRVSAFLAISLPLAAMSQAEAQASPDAMAQTGNWLKSSIASLSSAPAPASAQQIKVKRVAHAVPTSGVVRMRPFMPNRYLPHEKDLRSATAPQEPRMDESMSMEQEQPLSGQVDANYIPPRVVSSYDYTATMAPEQPTQRTRLKMAKSQVGTRTPRMVPGQMPLLPEQLTPQGVPIQTVIPEPPPLQSSNKLQFPVSLPAAAMPYVKYANRPQQADDRVSFDVPEFTPQEQMAMDRWLAQNKPTGLMDSKGDIYGMRQDNPVNGTGPAPSPMSFLPGNAMQHLGQSRRPAHVPAARFGSWHGSSALPDSGFHSYVARRQPTTFDFGTISPAHPPRRTYKQANSIPTHVAAAPRPARQQPAARQQSAAAPIILAHYPSYTSNRGNTY